MVVLLALALTVSAFPPRADCADLPASVFEPLQQAVQKPYLELFRIAPTLEFSSSQIERMRAYLKEAKRKCTGEFKNRAHQYDSRMRQAQSELKRVNARVGDPQRHDLHCQIQNVRAQKSEAELLASQAIPVAYKNEQAKLTLIEKWPEQLRFIRRELSSGSYRSRRWGDVEDIGFREFSKDQENDVKRGQEAIKEMKKFYGLGLALDLELLGVSREFELETDQLGVQYAWNSGYDTSGFIRFFDKMANKEGYVQGLSWFRTHPPIYERMVQAQREILFLPKKQNLLVQSNEFRRMKQELATVSVKAGKEDKKRPSLLSPEPRCPPPPKTDYKPGQPIETLCSQH